MERRTLLFLVGMVAMLLLAKVQAGAESPETQSADRAPVYASDMEFDPGAGITVGDEGKAYVNGDRVWVKDGESMHAGFFAPDGDGGYVWVGAHNPVGMPEPANEDGRELRLKVRELASQLFDATPSDNLAGMVALPLSFVHQDDFQKSSSFGRYLAEQMFYELNQRGFPTREYRALDRMQLRPAEGEFVLSRQLRELALQDPVAMVLTGTYYFDAANVFVNARLIKANSGMVLRTAHLTFPQTYVTRKMLTEPRTQLTQTYVGIQDKAAMTKARNLTDIDLGYDIR